MKYSSPLCSCIICHKEFSQKGIYTHFLDNHTDDGKQLKSLRGKKNTKNSREKYNEIKVSNKLLYLQNPKKCKFCGDVISYDKRENTFCNSVCSSSFNNKNRSKETHIKHAKSLSIYFQNKPKYSKIFYNNCTICSKMFISGKILKTCSKDCYKEALSRNAKNNKLGGNKNNKAYGWYISPYAGRVWLESSYEYRVANELDQLQIEWIRPKGVKYIANNKSRFYFPDFYIPSLNVYLDPKNDYLITKDIIKISMVESQNNIRIIILTEKDLTYDRILNILDTGFEPARELLPVGYKATAVVHLANPEY